MTVDRREFVKATSGALMAALAVGPAILAPGYTEKLVQYGSVVHASRFLITTGVYADLAAELKKSMLQRMRDDGVSPDETTFNLIVTPPDDGTYNPYKNQGTIGVTCYGRRRAA